MSDNNANKDSNQQEYNGVGKTSSILGQGVGDSIKGLAGGAVVGGAIGAVMHNKEKSEDFLEKGGLGKIREVLHTLAVNKGRFGRASGTAVLVALPVAAVAGISGLFRGAKKAEESRDQFNEITSENKELKGKLAATEASIEHIKSAVSQVEAPSEKSHVADIEAKRSQQSKSASIS
jgi:hypothetical protein